ncbi:MAG: hypothetical protein KGZ71_09960 [Desulfobulbaceae bacterium]|nr:hypothetical protein [Desulfobulbaceae bacterium]
MKILGKNYEVLILNDSPMMSNIGEIDNKACKIYINGGLSTDEQKETLLHETIHVVDYQLKLGLTEDQVHRLSVGLFTAIQDNWGGIPDIIGGDAKQ